MKEVAPLFHIFSLFSLHAFFIFSSVHGCLLLYSSSTLSMLFNFHLLIFFNYSRDYVKVGQSLLKNFAKNILICSLINIVNSSNPIMII